MSALDEAKDILLQVARQRPDQFYIEHYKKLDGTKTTYKHYLSWCPACEKYVGMVRGRCDDYDYCPTCKTDDCDNTDTHFKKLAKAWIEKYGEKEIADGLTSR